MSSDMRSLYRHDATVADGSHKPEPARRYGLPTWLLPGLPALIIGLVIWAVTGSWILILPAIGVAGVVIVLKTMMDKVVYYQSRGE